MEENNYHDDGRLAGATIYNEDCFATMERMEDGSAALILTSPPYNTNTKAGKGLTLGHVLTLNGYPSVRYDEYVDTKTNDEYVDWCVSLFDRFSRIVSRNGCVLWNMSYGTNNTECMFLTVSAILSRTEWTVSDMITWKKRCAMPNNVSPNRLTRICEYVFVFVRRSETSTARMNKEVASCRGNGQKMYKNVFNFIEAANNDGRCDLNKATFSTELCCSLLKLYATEGSCVYDPFIGTGTTANACRALGLRCIGSEISPEQCEYAKSRVDCNEYHVEVLKSEE